MKNRTPHLLLTSLLLLGFPGTANAETPSIIDPRILSAAEIYIQTELTSGMTLIYLEQGKAPAILSLGHTDYNGKGFPITPTSRFEIGSLTKLFTGLLAAECVTTKACRLQMSLQDLLPQQKLSQDLKKTTLIEILTHSSGLPALPHNMTPQNPEDPYADYSDDLLKAYLTEATTDKKGKYSYSNIGFGILGYALSQGIGSPPLINEMQTKILNPLGMTATSFEDLESLKLAVMPHKEGEATPRWHFQDTTAGAGALRSSGEDMAKFLAAEMFPETLEHPVLSQAIIESQRMLRTEGPLKGGQIEPSFGMGYGWHQVKIKEHSIFTHSGQTGGFVSFIGFDSERKRGAVILSNDTTDVSALGYAMLAPTLPISMPKDERQPEAKLKPYLGKYPLAPDFVITVTQRRGYLYIQATGQPALKIKPHDSFADLFKVEDVAAFIRFERDDKGRVSGLILDQNNTQQKAPRLAD
jgi:serine-type D-Ala-D-Ala carboxypeptidase/endopeptidase